MHTKWQHQQFNFLMITEQSYVTFCCNTILDTDAVYYESVLSAIFLFHISEKSYLVTFMLSKVT
jgi:hypothetical protein